jgi:tRNA/rRNA methyltransferase
MAMHGIDVLEQALQVTTLPEALQGCHRAVATTGRDRSLPLPIDPPELILPWLLEPLNHSQTEKGQSAMIFGREDRGLTNQELHYAQRLLHIPSDAAYPSLNLAQAIGICCYELSKLTRQTLTPQEPHPHNHSCPYSPSPLAPLDDLERYYQHLEMLLLKIGYVYDHTAASRMEQFRRLYNRAELSSQEVALLRGILSQVEWALNCSKT